MDDEAFAALVDDISTNGLLRKIIVWRDQVVDGWYRYLCCKQLHLEGEFDELPHDMPEVTVVALVESLNSRRKHSSASQRAVAYATVYQYRDAIPRVQQIASIESSDDNVNKTVARTTVAQAASDAGVSVRSMGDGLHVAKNGSEALRVAVLEGKIAVNVAARIAALPLDLQDLETAKELDRRAGLDEKSEMRRAVSQAVRMMCASSEVAIDPEIVLLSRARVAEKLAKEIEKTLPVFHGMVMALLPDELNRLRTAVSTLASEIGMHSIQIND
jgi:hypothetical protein